MSGGRLSSAVRAGRQEAAVQLAAWPPPKALGPVFTV